MIYQEENFSNDIYIYIVSGGKNKDDLTYYKGTAWQYGRRKIDNDLVTFSFTDVKPRPFA